MATTTIKRDQNTSMPNRDIKEDVVFVTGTQADAREVKMGLADDGLDILLDLLSDPSSDCGGYVLREAYSNAYDAVKSVGDGTGKIEITLPVFSDEPESNLAQELGFAVGNAAPKLVVADEGCGMTTEQVETCFVQYGGSTKRSATDAIGSKGLGALAPLSVSDQFSVTSVKDGVKTTAVIERRAGGNWATITTADTDEANGTAVEIPVSSRMVADQMRECASKLLAFTTDANLVVDGCAATDTVDGYVYGGDIAVGEDEEGRPNIFKLWVSDDMFPAVEEGWGMILGGYPYSSREAARWSNSNPRCFIEGRAGYLNFNLSRDEIKYDKAYSEFDRACRQALSAHRVSDELFADYLRSLPAGSFLKWVGRRRAINAVISDGKLSVRNDWGHGGSWSVPEDVLVSSDGSIAAAIAGKMTFEAALDRDITFDVLQEGEDYRGKKVSCFTSTKLKELRNGGFKAGRYNLADAINGEFRDYAAVIITGSDENRWKVLANDMRAFSQKKGIRENQFIAFCDDEPKTEIFDALFAKVVVTSQEEVSEAGREKRRSKKPGASAASAGSEVSAEDLEKQFMVIEGFSDDGEAVPYQDKWNRSSAGFADMSDCALAIGNVYSSHELSAIMGKAVEIGLTDKRYLVLFSKANPAAKFVNQAIANGAEVLVDCRSNAKNIPSLLGDAATFSFEDAAKRQGKHVRCEFNLDHAPAKWVSDNNSSFEQAYIANAFSSFEYHMLSKAKSFLGECELDGEQAQAREALGQFMDSVGWRYGSEGAVTYNWTPSKKAAGARKLAAFIRKYDLGNTLANDALKALVAPSLAAGLASEWEEL